MRGNSHARFLEGWAGAIPPGYSTGVGVSLARNRRRPKRPSEPRPSGAHPEGAEWKTEAQPPDALCSLNLCAFWLAVLYPNLLSGSGKVGDGLAVFENRVTVEEGGVEWSEAWRMVSKLDERADSGGGDPQTSERHR